MVTDDEQPNLPKSKSIYAGCFLKYWPIRDPAPGPDSKWYISEDVLPDSDVPNVRYAFGYGYVLSMDLVEHITIASRGFQHNQTSAPAWFAVLQSEDVVIGALVNKIAKQIDDCKAFQKDNEITELQHTLLVRHLGNESPASLEELAQAERWPSKKYGPH
jgi:hypothetical protein